MPQTYKGVTIPSYADTADAVQGFAQFVDSAGALGVCTSATRPAAPQVGHTVYNTDLDAHEVFNGASWVRVGAPIGDTHSWAVSAGPAITVNESDVHRVGSMVHVGFRMVLAEPPTGGFMKWDLSGVPAMLPRNTGVSAIVDDTSANGSRRLPLSGWAQPGASWIEVRLSGLDTVNGDLGGTVITTGDIILGGFVYPTAT